MGKPVVVIVGRPNVGKSTLFNRIIGSRRAIVQDIPGVTRDANFMDAVWEDREFVIVDTGGFYPEPEDDMFSQVREQALFAIEEASLIIHLLDAKDGMTSSDSDIARLLRASGRNVVWAVNKVDGPTKEDLLYDFYALGVDEISYLSAENGYNFDEFMDRVVSLLPEYAGETAEYPRVAVVGRPNVGKSTLINTLLGKRRLIVSPVAGTTRDSIDTVCSYYKKKYLFIDTAGIRKKDRAAYSIERFSLVRTLKSIERCDVALMLIDSSDGVVTEDQKIAGEIHQRGKGIVLVFNKWDMISDHNERLKRLRSDVGNKLWFVSHAPEITISGLERKRVTGIFPIVDSVMAERQKTLGRGELNRFLEWALTDSVIPSYKGKKIKVLFMSQVASGPPTFIIYSNYPEAIKDPLLRYIERRLREKYSFAGTPIIIMKRRWK